MHNGIQSQPLSFVLAKEIKTYFPCIETNIAVALYSWSVGTLRPAGPARRRLHFIVKTNSLLPVVFPARMKMNDEASQELWHSFKASWVYYFLLLHFVLDLWIRHTPICENGVNTNNLQPPNTCCPFSNPPNQVQVYALSALPYIAIILHPGIGPERL